MSTDRGAASAGQTGGGAIVSFRNVDKSYDGKIKVVDCLNLDIRDGEFLSLLGPSGSGKTTCLMMLAGFEDPTAGDILLQDRPLHHLPPYKRDMGVVFQNYALFPHMTAGGNVAYPLKMRGLPKAVIAEKVAAVLSLVGLHNLQDRRPAQLSGGQQQRVALARALVFEPKIVLMDEPLGALDKQLREHMQLEIKRIHDRLGITVVYVTHDQGEALTMSDRIAVFNGGKIQQIGVASEIYEHPVTTFVAGFIGENNRFDGVAEDVSGAECRIRLGDGSLVQAKRIASFGKGEEVALCVRPERLSIRNTSSANTFQARVDEVIYVGDHIRLGMNIFGDRKVVAKIPISDVTKELKIGEMLTISWSAEHCRALLPS